MAGSLYLDCSFGASGDMIVAALLDLGASEERLRLALASLPMVDEFDIAVSRAEVSGVSACDFDVRRRAGVNRDHDMAYLHGYAVIAAAPAGGEGAAAGALPADGDDVTGGGAVLPCCEEVSGAHGAGGACGASDVPDVHHGGPGHHEGAAHGHGAHAHGGHAHGVHEHGGHAHRRLADIAAIIDAADLTDGARALAHKAFSILAEAEGAAHGTAPEEVGFHEVGAVDSIVDIVAAAVLVDDLAPERIFATPLPDGCGTVRCQHGIIPVPVPAVRNVCLQQGVPFAHVDVEGELVTPTGAAIVAALEPSFALPPRYLIRAAGVGAGKRRYAVPSLVRASLIEDVGDGVAVRDERLVAKLECDIDDATAEELAYAADRLLEAGAREVHWLPIYTKKGRPAYQLQVICLAADATRLEEVVLTETPTIGVRRQLMERVVLARREASVETPFGPVRVKVVTLPDGSERAKPEHDDLAAIARREGLPLAAVRRAVEAGCD
ncbi:MAG: LarC family nickel insertion protein [Coriobacteriaceae bacterium]|nr:LarC family nickel insertion protein [Coriobacteriaceae bacterium]